MNKSGIYKITNLINGKVYIGSAVNIKQRWFLHTSTLDRGIHCNIHLQRSWNKFGKSNFEFSVIENCKPELLIAREQYHLDEYRSHSELYNICQIAGSIAGVKFSEESKMKISDATRGSNNPFYGKVHTEETKEKIGNLAKLRMINKTKHPMFGKHHTADAKKKLSIAHTGMTATEQTRQKMSAGQSGINNGFYGKRHSDATKAKIAESARGRITSEETRKKISAAGLGRKHSDATKIKIGLAGKGRKQSPESVARRLKSAWITRRSQGLAA
jgi:group I intron endonuclease